MWYCKYPLINTVLISFLLSLMTGCEKELTGYEKIVGTATINGKNYKESTVWAWNYKGYPSSIRLYESYKLFHFIARLYSEKRSENPSYTINFYISENDMQLKLNHPYKIDFYKELDVESSSWYYVVPYFSENRNEILAEDADGIAYVEVGNTEGPISLKGEFVIEKINSPNIAYGYYSLTSSGNDSERFVINGEFETPESILDRIY